jgi:two-component system, NtrC family, response regulator AtoC
LTIRWGVSVDGTPTLSTVRAGPVRADGQLTLVIVGEALSGAFPLPDAGDVVIGRSSEADIRIDHPSVSRRHAVLHLGPEITLEDLDSSNGSKVRGHRLEPATPVALAAGEPATLGGVVVVIQAAAPPPAHRQVWAHGHFQSRVEEECARADQTRAPFALLRLAAPREAGIELERALLVALTPAEVLGYYAPGEYEVIVPGDGATARARGEALRVAFEASGLEVRVGVACYPEDGRDPYVLLDRAGEGAGHESVPPTGAFVVESATMEKLNHLVKRVSAGVISVLITGETGVGKEVFAERIHRQSPRAEKPFLRLNCAALSETLLESELFGHERGAFTGAVQTKQGLLETAEGGTVFLDECGELPHSIQVKLLRVLEERQVLRVGSLKAKTIDVRFVAATNRDLEKEVNRGTFRQDLYFRLNGVTLTIPPLRQRVGEIAPLVAQFAAQAAQRVGTRVPKISREALTLLEGYSWPGNIRELRNVIERAVLLADDEVRAQHLPLERMTAAAPPPVPHARPAVTAALDETYISDRPPRGKLDRQRVIEALEKTGQNQTEAARLLGVSRRALINWIEKLGLPRPRKGGEES